MKTTPQMLSDAIRHDLLNIASRLPYTGQDHRYNIIWHYKESGWSGVILYIDTVTQYAMLNPAMRQNKATGETFYEKWYLSIKMIKQVIVKLKNRLFK